MISMFELGDLKDCFYGLQPIGYTGKRVCLPYWKGFADFGYAW